MNDDVTGSMMSAREQGWEEDGNPLDFGDELDWDPIRLVPPDSWVGHIPFAFWLVKALRPGCFVELGTHTGNSYFAFAQALAQFCPGARGYAVDTWQGDAHSGFYGDDVFVDVSHHNTAHFQRFSTLMRMSFEEARRYFPDGGPEGGIDLLHIDGLHSYEAVKQAFETWKNALSPRGVVVFHDTNVRERDFGVWRLWEELSGTFPSFEFFHSHGLGVLGVGPDQAPHLSRLFTLGREEQAAARIRQRIARRGEALQRQLEIEGLKRERDGALARIIALDAMVTERSVLLAARDELIRRFQNQAEVRDELILIRDRQIDARDQQASQLRAQAEATKRLYVNATSWKITAPLRAAIRLARTGRLLAPRVEIAEETQDDPLKTAMHGRLTARLDSFLGGSEVLRLKRAETPEVSILLVLHHRAECTIGCLDAILETLGGGDPGIEIVIVDNGSTDRTGELLERVEGATVIRSPVELPFVQAVNLGAGSGRGKNLLLLDNAVLLLPGALGSALKTLDSAEDIGAVGGRIILPDGRLAQAGAILWRDGAFAGYGEGGDPADPDFMFQRDVDFCSGAFLLTKMQVFRELGGFDARFAPGGYGAADYCVRVWESGRRVVYDPDAAIIHEEFGGAAPAVQAADRAVFVGRHAGWLARQFEAAPANLWAARAARSTQPRILMLEDRVPKPELGAGYPRSNRLLHELLEAGAQVTFFPMYRHQESWESVRRALDKRIEMPIHAEGSGIGAYLSARRGIYDAILVCRPHNMNVLLEAMGAERDLIGTAKLIYDAEAFFVTRTLQRMKADGRPATELERRRLSAKEIMLAWCADEVISVSAAEKEILETYGAKRIHVLGHALEDAALPSGFEARDQIVFLGAMPEDDAPNADAVRWFASEILPEIRRSLGQNLRLTVIGRAEAPTIRALDGDRVDLLGMVDELAPALARARLLVVPTRFAAGLPHKVHQAAMLGIPMVVTELIFGQLGWERDADVLVADDPHGFAAAYVRLYRDGALWERMRGHARARAVRDCDPEAFRATVGEIVRGIPLTRVLGRAA